jgi:ferric-dicitrate binding protein FerR (iron transport regulator)
MSRKAFYHLLKRYLEGKSTAEEKRIVEQWYGMLDDDEVKEIRESELSAVDEKIWNSINTKINIREERDEQHETDKPVRSLWVKLAVAASVIGILVTSVYLLNTQKTRQPDFLSSSVSNSVVNVNNTSVPLVVQLEDGSTVTLQPQSKITYPKKFETTSREVAIEGEAFFDISKDRTRPFYVYSQDLITQVVGTSFTVKTGTKDQKSEVVVYSGKVMVSKNQTETNLLQNILSVAEKKIVLTPNQKVTYEPGSKDLVVTLVDQPAPLTADSNEKTEFIFNETPLQEVLHQLEKGYGLAITVDDSKIYKCTFTGDITEQDLYTKLDFVCQSIGATYKVEGTEITILGGGHCN